MGDCLISFANIAVYSGYCGKFVPLQSNLSAVFLRGVKVIG